MSLIRSKAIIARGPSTTLPNSTLIPRGASGAHKCGVTARNNPRCLRHILRGGNVSMRLSACFLAVLAIFASGAGLSSQAIDKEVRHELVMLPYDGIFDDLALRVDGRKIELLGAVTRP